MSNLVDERIVEMSFDNKNFEKNVKTSMNTIDQLKSSLNFSGISSSMKNNLNSVDTSHIIEGLSNASKGFSAFEVVAITAISNITNRILDLGIEMIKSLSVDNIIAGWGKFEEKTKSVATLSAQGYDMETVNQQLEKLNWFTDETSYSFTEMVSNISKFTASGQGLEESVQAMMGIANWAALSGQNADVASRAMYQLAQAMSKGSIQLADWKSIQNANMDTQEFRQKALDAAVAAGTLTQAIDGTYTTLAGNTFDINSFTSHLTSDNWFTADILMSALSEYSSAVDTLYEKVQSDDSISTTSEAIAKYGDELSEFGLKAFRAAQEAKTFKDVIDSVKDAVASGWMNTFENVFGNYDEAKVLWTDLANELYDVFVSGINANNEILKEWKELGGRNDLFINTEEETGAFWNLLYAIFDIKKAITDAWQAIFPKKTAEQLKNFTERLKELTAGLRLSEETAEKLTDVFKGIFSVIKLFINILKSLFIAVRPILSAIKALIGLLLGFLASIANGFSEFVGTTNIFIKAGQRIANVLTIIINEIKSLGIINGLVKMVNTLKNSFVKAGGTSNNFSRILDGLKAVIGLLVDVFLYLYSVIKTYIFPILGSLLTFAASILGTFGGTIIRAFAWIGDVLVLFVNFIRTSETLNKVFGAIKRGFTSLLTAMKNFFGSFKKIDTGEVEEFTEDVTEKFSPLEAFMKGLSSLFSGLWSILKSLLPILSKAMEFVGKLFKTFAEKISGVFGGEGGGLDLGQILSMGFLVYVAKSISDVIYMFKGITNAIADVIGSFGDLVYSKAMMQYAEALKTFAIAILILVAALILISLIDDKELKRSMGVLLVMVGTLVAVMMIMKKMMATTGKLGVQSLVTAYSMKIATEALIKIAIAVAIMALALKLLSTMTDDQLMQGLKALILIMALLLTAAAIIGKNQKIFRKGAKGLIGMAIAVWIMSRPLKAIGKMKPTEILKGIVGIAAIAGIFVFLGTLSKFMKKSLTTSYAMIQISIALLIASLPLRIIGGMGWKKLAIGISGLLAIAGVMVLLGSLSKYMKGAIFTSMAMLIIGTAMIEFAIAALILGSMKWSSLLKAGTAMVGLAMIMALIGQIFGFKTTVALIGFATSLLIVSSALIAFGIAVAILSFMKWSSILKAIASILVLASVMVLVGKIFGLKTTVLLIAFATSLMIVSAALIAFGIAVAILSFMSFKSIAKALLVLVGVLIIFGIAGMALQPLVPAIMGLALAMMLFAGAIFIISVALALLVITLGIFGTSLATLLKLLAQAIISAAPMIALAIGALLSAIFQALTMAVKDLFILLDVLIVNILNFLMTHGPSIIETVITLLDNLLQSLADHFPSMAKSLVSMLISLLETIKEHIVKIVNLIVDIIINIIDTLTTRLPDIMKSVTKFLSAFIDNTITSLQTLIPKIVNGIVDVILLLLDGMILAIQRFPEILNKLFQFLEELLYQFGYFLGKLGPELLKLGIMIIKGIIKGLKEGVKDVGGAIKDVGKGIVDGFKNFFNIKSPSRLMAEMGMYLDQGLAKGIEDNSYSVVDSVDELGQETINAFQESGMTKAVQNLYDALNTDMDNELVIKPIMDLTEIQNGTNEIFGMMKNVDGYNINGSNDIANKTAYDISSGKTKQLGKEQKDFNNQKTTDSTQTFYNTFNISGTTNPKEIAKEVSEIMQIQKNRSQAKYGKSNI